MISARTLIPALLLLSTLPLAHAIQVAPCDASPCCDSNGTPALGVVDTGAGFFVDDRGVLGGGIWIYEDSNGDHALERGGSSILVPGDDDPCFVPGDTSPDTLIV